ncbi:hypothetical protein COLO4_19735 [Corchorus olitorius]|uniref:Uncharacterized protein n=1 Tax=Corchorus olitorius TaxID=93759 RepID=A0A1R3J3S5_9ROSI|nr:hypothetical protein COLO4_19735 [Corchorus olitorius]
MQNICQHHPTGFGYKCDRCTSLGHVMVVVKRLDAGHIIARNANLLWVLNVLRYQPELNTNVTRNIFLLSLTVMIMTILQLITVTFARKEEIRVVGFIILQLVILLLMSNAFLEIFHSSKVASILNFNDGTSGTFVKKIYNYPKCVKCGKPCQDLAFKWKEPGCSYYFHPKCCFSKH